MIYGIYATEFLAATLVLTGACSQATDQPRIRPAGPAASARPAVPTVAPLPGMLPTFDDASSVEQTVRTIIRVAATRAIGVPEADRDPVVQAVTTQTVCQPTYRQHWFGATGGCLLSGGANWCG